MRKLIVQEWLSLDGHVADKQGKLDWFAQTIRQTYPESYHSTFIDGIDCILLGRKTYDQFAALWPARQTEDDFLARKINTAQKIVFSSSLQVAPWGKWNEAKVETGNPVVSVRELKSLQGKNIILWGSISLVQLMMKERLIDEYHLHVCPVITGGGRKFFAEGSDPAALKLVDTKRGANEVVSLIYQTNN
jgi:dihydrofolate reductase